MSVGPDHWQGMQSEQYYIEEALTGAKRAQNILENSELEAEYTGENFPWDKWLEYQCNASEHDSCIKAACNYSEDKGVQNESNRAGLSYK